jgi:predicted DNA-binding ribbon-helix-helix protein
MPSTITSQTVIAPAANSALEAEFLAAAADEQRVVHRIIQCRGRRYSLKLDQDVWQILEEAALRRGIRINHLIDGLANVCPDGGNLSAALRAYSIDELKRQMQVLQDQLRDQAMNVGQGVSAAVIADSCPAPCFLVNAASVVLKANAAAQKWLGLDEAALRDRPLDQYMQVKSPVSLPQIVSSFARGRAQSFPARIICLRPGRLIMAKATLCPAVVRSEQDLIYFLMIEAN